MSGHLSTQAKKSDTFYCVVLRVLIQVPVSKRPLGAGGCVGLMLEPLDNC